VYKDDGSLWVWTVRASRSVTCRRPQQCRAESARRDRCRRPAAWAGYVDELLSYGTGVLVRSGAARIVADTDAANRGMRAAFARAGYDEFASRRDYLWTAIPVNGEPNSN